jgi:hypothetical protein
MTIALSLIGTGITSLRTTTQVIESGDPIADGDAKRVGSDDGYDSGWSVAGEEDPGAALDLVDREDDGTGASCPWPRERSA